MKKGKFRAHIARKHRTILRGIIEENMHKMKTSFDRINGEFLQHFVKASQSFALGVCSIARELVFAEM